MKRYHDSLIQALKNPDEAAAYLNAALDDGDKEMFLVALKNVAEAYGGMAKVSRKLHLNRPNLYKALSKKGNPEIKTLSCILNHFGLSLAVVARPKSSLKAA